MKSWLTVTTAVLLLSCSGTNLTKYDPNELMERGWIDRSALMGQEYLRFKVNYDSARVDSNFIEMIKLVHGGIDVVVVLGTWCGDSKREVPRFLKIADLASIPPSRVRYYAVDRTKNSPDGVTSTFRIERVPTFIFLKQGEEVGRIVESPRTSLEEEMLTILADAQNK